MRPLHLRPYLKDPGPGGGYRLDWLAVLARRPFISLQHALADQEPPAGTASRHPPDSRQSKRSKAELFTLIRRDAREHGLSARALAESLPGFPAVPGVAGPSEPATTGKSAFGRRWRGGIP